MSLNDKIKGLLPDLIKDHIVPQISGANVIGTLAEESIDEALTPFREKIARFATLEAQKWLQWSDDGPVLYPDNTRLYYRVGDAELVLQELPPSIRYIKMSAKLAQCSNSEEQGANEFTGFSLALPYVVLLHKFEGGLLKNTYVTFNDRPLKHLNERPLKPYLSNVNTELSLCHGSSMNVADLEVGNIAQQISYITDLFWQTTYVDELGEHFWAYKTHFSDHPNMSSFEKWQAKSLENPLFVLENEVEWLPHKYDSYGAMIASILSGNSVRSQQQQQMYQNFVDEFMEGIKQALIDLSDSYDYNLQVPDAMVDQLVEKINS